MSLREITHKISQEKNKETWKKLGGEIKKKLKNNPKGEKPREKKKKEEKHFC